MGHFTFWVDIHGIDILGVNHMALKFRCIFWHFWQTGGEKKEITIIQYSLPSLSLPKLSHQEKGKKPRTIFL